jgi:hypothetical protein
MAKAVRGKNTDEYVAVYCKRPLHIDTIDVQCGGAGLEFCRRKSGEQYKIRMNNK